MIGDIIRVIAKVAGFAGGITLIGVIIMWFGCIPMVATIFGEISGGMYLCFTGIMILLIVLVVRWLKS